ncbi:MAG: fumarylacetoacetate hydrolase family protein [Burkholderiales bacterium]
MDAQAMRRAAELLAESRLARRPLVGLPADLTPTNEAEAYAVQQWVHSHLSARGLGPVTGHKIGCTTAVMQAFLNIPNPCAGGVFERTVHRSPATIRHADFVRVGVECEIVARLGRNLPPSNVAYTRSSVVAAVCSVMAGMEIVDARYVDYSKLDTPTLIADDFFDAGCVLGVERQDIARIDLAALVGVTWINGTEAGRGRGADVMGHPFEALAWLANLRSRQGSGLHAGEFVFLGSVVETKWVSAGDVVTMEIDQLGRIEATFA